jgi:hypothetical protein
VAKWKVDRAQRCGPEQGLDTEAAYAVMLKAEGEEEAQTTVEWVDGKMASMFAAHLAVGPYRDWDRPPRRLIVARDGEVGEHLE